MDNNEKEARERAIRWIRQCMALYGMTVADLEAAGCFMPPRRPCYRNAQGQRWDGQGEMPDWLQRAIHAGQTLAFYRTDG